MPLAGITLAWHVRCAPPHQCFAPGLHVVLIDTPDSAIVNRAVASALCLYRAVPRADKLQGCTYVTLRYVSPSSVRRLNYRPKRVAENVTIRYISRNKYIFCFLFLIHVILVMYLCKYKFGVYLIRDPCVIGIYAVRLLINIPKYIHINFYAK